MRHKTNLEVGTGDRALPTAFAGAVLLSSLWPRGRLAFAALAILIAFSRVYLGVHYPTDVLAGAAIGSAFAVVVIYIGNTVKHVRGPLDIVLGAVAVLVITVSALITSRPTEATRIRPGTGTGTGRFTTRRRTNAATAIRSMVSAATSSA